ncbi:MAG: HAD hydrolase-like protein [Lachnospiraceae bacterium]|nr:HAD hydrolase-like protein [Lachnospiraceae bacterium]
MRYRYILFDLDGTVTNPKEGITKSFAYALESFGIKTENRDELCKVIGPPLTQSFREFYGFTKEQALLGAAKYRERYEKIGWAENEVYEGMEEALAALSSQGAELILATSKPERFAVRIMEHFGLAKYFTALCGADDYAQNRSTKEEVVRYALEQNGITDVGEVIMVGDRKYDVTGAAALGIKTVGVLYGFGDEKELTEAGALHLVKTPRELAEYLGV